MVSVGMHEAKTNLSKLVEQALAGEEVIITRRGEAVVRLEAVREKKRSFADALGSMPDIWVADDFDELPDDIARAFGMID
jgi:prevent-host-death family protein